MEHIEGADNADLIQATVKSETRNGEQVWVGTWKDIRTGDDRSTVITDAKNEEQALLKLRVFIAGEHNPINYYGSSTPGTSKQ